MKITALTAPRVAVEPPAEWAPPAPRVQVGLDLAFAVARDRLDAPGMDALLGAWIETHGEAGLVDAAGLAALGARPPAGLRAGLLDREPVPVSPALGAMDAALAAGSRAEAALLAVLVLEGAGGAELDPDSFARIISALDAAGLRQQALTLVFDRLIRRVA